MKYTRHDKDLILKYLNDGLPYSKVAELCNCNVANVRYVARKYMSKNERIMRGVAMSGPSVSVAAIDISTGETVKVFPSIGEAERWLGVNSKGYIGRILNTELSYHGFRWIRMEN